VVPQLSDGQRIEIDPFTTRYSNPTKRVPPIMPAGCCVRDRRFLCHVSSRIPARVGVGDENQRTIIAPKPG